MEEHEKYAVYVFFIVALISVGAITFLFVNAKSSHPQQLLNPYFLTGGLIKHVCWDSDNGVVPYERGITKTEDVEVVDRCTVLGDSEGVLEYSCTPDGSILATSIPCQAGCYEGRCMKYAATSYAFNPFLNNKIKKIVVS
ncbi:hypothetical protein HY485_00655 [Candidatus Woesearchaeota archaeon]|nr:hypothetical protein [Candidatus Woesearchaeota archaeon]